MEWCDLNITGQYRLRNLRRLIASLDYMKEKGYLGKWVHTGENNLITENKSPFELQLILTPPDWFCNEIELIQNKREIFLEKKPMSLSTEEFCTIFKESGFTSALFGKRLGITSQYVGLLRSGKRKVSKKNSSEGCITQKRIEWVPSTSARDKACFRS